MESSCLLLHNHFLAPPPSAISSSTLLSHTSRAFLSNNRNIDVSRRRIKPLPPVASLRTQNPHPQDFDNCRKRALLVLGFSIIPFIPWKDKSLESLASAGDEQISAEGTDKNKELLKAKPSNPVLAFLNAIGILGAGVLAALYSLLQNDKEASEKAVECLKAKLGEKDATIVSMEEEFESKLLHEQEERNKLLSKAKEEQLSLVQQLVSANSTVKGLGSELQSDKKRLEWMKVEMENIKLELMEVRKDKSSLEVDLKEKDQSRAVLQERIDLLTSEIRDKEESISSLSSSLSAMDLDLKNVNSAYAETKIQLAEVESDALSLRHEILKTKSELEENILAMNELNAALNSSAAEREDLRRRFGALLQQYEDLKSSSEKRAASDAQLLGEREHELRELNQKFELTVSKVSTSKALISELTEDREVLKRMLDTEANSLKSVRHELKLTQEALGQSRYEASGLEKELKQSTDMCLQLQTELSRVQAEFSEVENSLKKSQHEAESNAEALSIEVSSAKDSLQRTQNELQIVSNELKAAIETRDSLKKELIDVYKKAESAINELSDQKKVVSSLSREKQSLEIQMSKDKEARKSLEIDLDDATKSLDQMNMHVKMLTRDLEMANSRISSLEEEKEFLYKSLEEQKRFSHAAQENFEVMQNLVMNLGDEKENLERRARILEDDLASTKGEILRLRTRANSSKTIINNKSEKETELDGSMKSVIGDLIPERAKQDSSKITVSNGQLQEKTEPANKKVAARKTARKKRPTSQ